MLRDLISALSAVCSAHYGCNADTVLPSNDIRQVFNTVCYLL